MIPVYVLCAVCLAAGGWVRCVACDGLFRQWAPGAPAYGCQITLADREPGEIVTLGNGQRAKILWHLPYKRENGRPETTFLDILVEFYETETFIPIPYPSCIGVSSVETARFTLGGGNGREVDAGDPLQRHAGALL